MANVKPFRGYRYNKDMVGDIGKQVSPPYYNINPKEKAELYEISDYNSVRLFSGKEYDDDDSINNKFTRAAHYLKEWISADVLRRDETPAIYMYEETMQIGDMTYSNRSFVTLLELEDLGNGVVMSCEEIREVSLQDRYEFLTATNADMSIITCLYSEREKDLLNLMNALAQEEPDVEFDSNDGIHQRIWVITYEPTINLIMEKFKPLPLYITDGQTRYETCIQYRNYKKANNPDHTGKEPYNYTMVSLINSRSDGLVVVPVHRGVKCPRGFKLDFFVSMAQDHFKIEKIIVDQGEGNIIETMRKQIATTKHETRIAMYCGGDFFYRMTLTDKDFIKKELLPEMSKAYCALDVVVLNKLILGDILNINEDNYSERVTSSRNYMEMKRKIDNGELDAMFIMNPVKTDQIESVTSNGEKLPNATLSIFPKPSVGVVINIKED
ncbi:MAG: DUF1015 domain-containing protein [Clostridiales bacterium]|nr:DUF1015 domain-containing protein [Clostridiales bacterium]